LALGHGLAGGIPLGGLGYRGPACAFDLAEEADMLLITRDRAPTHRFVLSHVRQQVETTFSQLCSASLSIGYSAARGPACGIPFNSKSCTTTCAMLEFFLPDPIQDWG